MERQSERLQTREKVRKATRVEKVRKATKSREKVRQATRVERQSERLQE